MMARRRGRLAIGLPLAAGIAVVARRARTLTPDGAVAATAVGGIVFAATGLRGAAALVSFFLTSSALGRVPPGRGAKQARGATRDAVQVLANGGVPAACALASAVVRAPWHGRMAAAYAGAVAAAAADTWATEIGGRLGKSPRSIATLAPVPAGTSGGITVAGLLGSLGGAALVAQIINARSPRVRTRLATLVAGMAGSLADSLLGATVQERRVCSRCHGMTEARTCCGQPTIVLGGVPGITNDAVNVMATAAGAAVGAALHRV